jgi:flagellar biosynthetic protein FlhB
MAELTGDKTQEPTSHRRQQAREQGQVARSRDASSALLLCGAVITLLWLGGPIVDFLGNLTIRQLGGDPWLSADISFVTSEWSGLLTSLAVVLLPILGLMMLLAISGNVLQVGLIFLPGKILPDFSRIDPLEGFSRLVSLANFGRLAFGFIKLVVVTSVAWYCLDSELERVLNSGHLPVAELAAFMAQIIVWTTLKIGVALLAIAGMDYAYERWRHERDLRMTSQEIREELRSMHGDPQVMSRRRAWHRQSRAAAQVASTLKADLLIVDGKGLAVAVRYDASSMSSPLVVAKGAGPAASKMRESAEAQRVPCATEAALTRSLYEGVSLNRPVPQEFYGGVAELLGKKCSVAMVEGSRPAPAGAT